MRQLAFFLALALPAAALAQTAEPTVPLDDPYFKDGQATLEKRREIAGRVKKAKNVILFVGDGMDPTTVAAARIYDGQERGETGEENYLSFERLPYLAMAKTYNTDAQTPDSAGTMSAMVTGVKTKAGMISVTDAAAHGDCKTGLAAQALTLGELAEKAGLSTGVISTARLTHATPAAVYSHAPDRDWETDGDLTDEAREAGCRDIARQLIEFPYGDGLEVALGGGRSNFLPAEEADPEYPERKGRRRDGRNLIAEWSDKSPAHAYVWNRQEFAALDASSAPRVLGLFEPSHMQYELDREADAAGEPSLAEMTGKAIDILAANRKGYFLMVEAGRIDHAHHGGNAARALKDTQALSEAVATALEKAGGDTLIVVTADHGHTIAFQGYPARGNPILGLANSIPGLLGGENAPATAADGKPYTTLVYANGPGSVFHGEHEDGRPAPTPEEVADPAYRQQALIPSMSETHGGQDVPVYATGPGAALFGGVFEQSYIFHAIDAALDLRKKAGVQ